MAPNIFEIGDLVWAKMKGYPPWPGQISAPPPDCKFKASCYYILFYGSNDYGWISDKNIEVHSNILVMKYTKKQKRSSTYLNAVKEIVNASKNFKKNKKKKDLKLQNDKTPSKNSLKMIIKQEIIDEDDISVQKIPAKKTPYKKRAVTVKRNSVATNKKKVQKTKSPRKNSAVKDKSSSMKKNLLKNSAIQHKILASTKNSAKPVIKRKTSLKTNFQLVKYGMESDACKKSISTKQKTVKAKFPKGEKNLVITTKSLDKGKSSMDDKLLLQKQCKKLNSFIKQEIKTEEQIMPSIEGIPKVDNGYIERKHLTYNIGKITPFKKQSTTKLGFTDINIPDEKGILVEKHNQEIKKEEQFVPGIGGIPKMDNGSTKRKHLAENIGEIIPFKKRSTTKSGFTDIKIPDEKGILVEKNNQEIKKEEQLEPGMGGIPKMDNGSTKRKHLAENIGEIIPFKKQSTTKSGFTDINIPDEKGILVESNFVVSGENHIENKMCVKEENTSQDKNGFQVTAISSSVLAEKKAVITENGLIDKKMYVDNSAQKLSIILGAQSNENISAEEKFYFDKTKTFAEKQSKALFKNSLVSERNNFVGMKNQTHFIDYVEGGKYGAEENGLVEKNILFEEENYFKVPAPLSSNQISVQNQKLPADKTLQRKSAFSKLIFTKGMSHVESRISDKDKIKKNLNPLNKFPLKNTTDSKVNTSIEEKNIVSSHLEKNSVSTDMKLHTPEMTTVTGSITLKNKTALTEKITCNNICASKITPYSIRRKLINDKIILRNALAFSKRNKNILKQNAFMKGNKVIGKVPTFDNFPIKETKTTIEKQEVSSKNAIPKTLNKQAVFKRVGFKGKMSVLGAKKNILKKVKEKVIKEEIIKKRLNAFTNDDCNRIYPARQTTSDEFSELHRFIPPNYTCHSEAIINFNNEMKSGLNSNSEEIPCFSEDYPFVKKIGFLGLGNVGQRLVRYLLSSGHSLVLWNRTSHKYNLFQGVQVMDNPKSVIETCDIIFSCLSDPEASKEVVFGKCGVLEGLDASLSESPAREFKKGYIELTSLDPETSKKINNAITLKGGRYLEALVNGVRNDGKEGFRYILTAGDNSLYDDCKSCFYAFTMHSLYLGDYVGVASKFNIVQYTFLGNIYAAMAECLSFIQHIGLRGYDFLKILSEGIFKSTNFVDMGHVIAKKYPGNIYIQNVKKNINLALSLGNTVNLPMPVTTAAREVFKISKLISNER